MALKKPCKDNLYALILAGGIGSRFWPFSRELEPKQFLKIISDKSLLQDTIHRLRGFVKPSHIFIITNKTHFYELKKQIEEFLVPEDNIILEPEGKNTAPAIGLFARIISMKDKNAIFITLPSDHYIKDKAAFKQTLGLCVQAALDGFLACIGIKPTKAATGYGYIKIKRVSKKYLPKQLYYRVGKFFEKPNLDKAKKMVSDKNYFWNSGIFVWKASVFLKELSLYLPDLSRRLSLIKSLADVNKIWPGVKPISVDYGIMEHSKQCALVVADFDWTDLGSWDALRDILKKDSNGNIIKADVISDDCRGCSIFSRSNRLICSLGLKDLIIADTPDALLVCNKEKAQDVRFIVQALKLNKRKEYIAHTTDKRPWGSYTVLQIGQGFKVKLVEISPRKRLSLQRHRKRAEHWVVVSGVARVICGDSKKIVRSNESIYIPNGVKHRLENPGPGFLRIVEVQTGTYLEEDDIERFADDFEKRA